MKITIFPKKHFLLSPDDHFCSCVSWWASNSHSIKDPISWALFKKLGLSLDQARAILKMLNRSLPKKTYSRLKPITMTHTYFFLIQSLADCWYIDGGNHQIPIAAAIAEWQQQIIIHRSFSMTLCTYLYLYELKSYVYSIFDNIYPSI